MVQLRVPGFMNKVKKIIIFYFLVVHAVKCTKCLQTLPPYPKHTKQSKQSHTLTIKTEKEIQKKNNHKKNRIENKHKKITYKKK